MEHHASYLSWLLTELLHLQRHAWGSFAHGEPLSFLERYDYLFAAVLAMVVTMILVSITKRRKVPGPWQQTMEFVVTFFRGLSSENIDHHPEKYMPLIGTLGFFILLNNFFGLTPMMPSGTANWNVTLGCAVLVFLHYNYQGMKEQGIGKYWLHFAGPIWWLSWLIFPLEIVGLVARILSHSMRLFGNIAGEHVVSAVFFVMLPIFLPLPMMFLGVFFGLVQTFVFVILTAVYIGGAVAHEH
nr:F0F1 ATP synthase subunit A [uncultured Holophaga sp.]